MIYKLDTDTPSYLCDATDHLHVWAAIRLCQEVTEYHGNATGIGFKTLIQQNRAWVISRAYYEIYRRPDAFEHISLSTWSRGDDGLFGFRDYRVLTTQGELLMAGTSYWPLIDFNTRRAVRLKGTIENYESHSDNATSRTVLERLRPTVEIGEEPIISTIVRPSMLDHTQHVNNSEYIKLIFDAQQQLGMQVDRPISFEVNYNLETQLGEKIDIRCCHNQSDDSFHSRVDNNRGLSVTTVTRYLN